MIKQIKLKNFFSFSDETIELHREVNILIGINGSGKSNFFKAIRLLYEAIAGKGLRAFIYETLGGFDNIIFKGISNNSENVVELEFLLDYTRINEIGQGEKRFDFKQDIIYIIRLIRLPATQNYSVEERILSESGFIYLEFNNGHGHLHEIVESQGTKLVKYNDFNPQELVLREVSDTDRYLALTTIRKALRGVVIYDYFDTTPNSAIRKASNVSSGRRLNVDGSNLPSILNSIKNSNKPAYTKIIEALRDVNGNFVTFDYQFFGAGNLDLMLEEKELKSSVHVSSISDGTLKYICLMAILYNPEQGNLICIDEPESGLHPDMIYNVSEALKESSEWNSIVIATHSPSLLDNFSFENVRVLEKDDKNSTKVVSYSKEQFEGWYKTFNLGQMWIAGNLGGVRYGG